MAPKKKKGKKSDDPAKFVDKENLKRAEGEILSLQKLLELRTNESLESRRSERVWRERVGAFEKAIEQQREDTLDITSDMLRQYKSMQEKLVTRINELEVDNNRLTEEMKQKDEEVKMYKSKYDDMKATSEAEIKTYKRKMELMQQEFADMLKQTLDKMHERLEIKGGKGSFKA